MKLADLTPNLCFEDPAIPPARGADAELFHAYATYREAEAKHLQLDEAVMRDAALEEQWNEAVEIAGRARIRFMTLPACTREGVLLKLQFALSGDSVPEDGSISNDLGFLYSAIVDLKAMPPIEAGDVKRVRAGA